MITRVTYTGHTLRNLWNNNIRCRAKAYRQKAESKIDNYLKRVKYLKLTWPIITVLKPFQYLKLQHSSTIKPYITFYRKL